MTKVSPDGSTFTTINCCSGDAAGVAVDQSDNVWVAVYSTNTVGLVSSSGQVLSGTGITGGGLEHPQAIAIDGAGRAWVANYRGPSLTELGPSSGTVPGQVLSPSTGWGSDAALLLAFGIAIDAGGNLWVSNFGSNTRTKFVGWRHR